MVLRIVFNPAIHYSKGEKLFDSGKFSAAAEQFSAAGDYKDAASKAKRATAAQSYADGEAKFNAGDYTAASALFTAAAGYEDAAERVRQSQLGVHYKAAETSQRKRLKQAAAARARITITTHKAKNCSAGKSTVMQKSNLKNAQWKMQLTCAQHATI